MASIRRLEGKSGPSYKITVSEGLDERGHQIRHFMTWRPDRPMTERQMMKEAQRIAMEFEQDIQAGFQVDNRQTFDEYAAYVLKVKEEQGAAENTLTVYRAFLERISPYVGYRRIVEIRPQHLTALYMDLKRVPVDKNKIPAILRISPEELLSGLTPWKFAEKCGIKYEIAIKLTHGRNVSLATAEKVAAAMCSPVNKLFDVQKKETISTATIWRIHSFLSIVFSQAEREMIVKFNPAARATPPRRETKEANHYQPETVERIVEALEGEPLKWKALIYVMMVTGARRGEVLAMKWKNVDFANRQIKIDGSISYLPDKGVYEGPTKTRANRYVSIPAEVAELLRQHKVEQMEMRLMYGPEWTESDYVFTGEKGGAMVPTVINTTLNIFARKHNLPKLNPHAFRHTAASIMIANGTDILTVSKMLGHASTNTTTEIYGHLIEAAKAKAADCLADVILQRKKA